MNTRKEKISSKAVEILKNNPDGIRYSELIIKLKQEFPDYPRGTLHGTIWRLDALLPDKIYKPARGLFRHIDFQGKEISEAEREIPTRFEKIKEENFYKPFANWLESDVEDCTRAIPLGGNKFKDKWGTPDVIGKREPSRSDIIQSQTEIVAAEIKTDSKDLIAAFGQACSYKLFSHKSYLVIPKSSLEDDVARIDSLCQIFGIGLILFDNTNVETPQFEIRVRSRKQEPDMFYANKYAKVIEKELFA